MKISTYKRSGAAIRLITCGIIAYSVLTANWVAMLAAIIGVIALEIILRFAVKGIVEDERTGIIAQKATGFSYNLENFGMTVAGVILVFTNRGNLSGAAAQTGYVLFFIAFGMSIIKDIASFFYSRRMSGRE